MRLAGAWKCHDGQKACRALLLVTGGEAFGIRGNLLPAAWRAVPWDAGVLPSRQERVRRTLCSVRRLRPRFFPSVRRQSRTPSKWSLPGLRWKLTLLSSKAFSRFPRTTIFPNPLCFRLKRVPLMVRLVDETDSPVLWTSSRCCYKVTLAVYKIIFKAWKYITKPWKYIIKLWKYIFKPWK